MIYDDLISGYWICFDNYIIVQCCSLRMRCPAVRQSMRWNWPGVKSDGIGTPWFRPKLPSVGAVPRCRNQGENMGNTWRMLSQLAELFFLWYHLWSDKHHRFHSDFPTFLWYETRAQRWRSLPGVQDAEERPTDEFGRLKLSAQEDKHRRNMP